MAPSSSRRDQARGIAVLLIWLTATLVILSCAFAAYLMSVDWGDGRDKGSAIELVSLGAAAVLTAMIAVWLTRRLR